MSCQAREREFVMDETPCLSRNAAGSSYTENCGGTWGEVSRKLAEQKVSRIEEGCLLPDDVDMMIAIPPKYAVSQVMGFMKGKSAGQINLWR